MDNLRASEDHRLKRPAWGYGDGVVVFKKVLLCFDGTEAGRRALRRGAELAILVHAEVVVLSILPAGVADPVVIAGALGSCVVADHNHHHQRVLDGAIEWLKVRGVAARGYLTTGDTIERILAFKAKFGIDLIVLGHYPQPSGGFWWGSSKRTSLAEATGCCIFVAVDAGPDS